MLRILELEHILKIVAFLIFFRIEYFFLQQILLLELREVLTNQRMVSPFISCFFTFILFFSFDLSIFKTERRHLWTLRKQIRTTPSRSLEHSTNVVLVSVVFDND